MSKPFAEASLQALAIIDAQLEGRRDDMHTLFRAADPGMLAAAALQLAGELFTCAPHMWPEFRDTWRGRAYSVLQKDENREP